MTNQEYIPFSIDIEKYCLSLMAREPNLLSDILYLVNEKDFHINAHRSIFQIIKSCFEESKTVDRIILLDKINNLNIKMIDGTPAVDYLDAIMDISKVKAEKWADYIRELKKYSISRKIYLGAEDVQKFVRNNINEPIGNLVSHAEEIFVNCVTSYVEEAFKPVDLHENIEEYIEGLGNNPMDDGIVPPFPKFYKKYGGFRKGEMSVFAAGAGQGKSTFLNHIAINAALDPRNKCKVLILDTELDTETAMQRRVAAISEIGHFYIRTGQWRLNQDMASKVRATLAMLKECKGKIDHIYAANMPIEEVVSLIRRWCKTQVPKGHMPLIVYDYLKLTGENVTDSWKEYQVIGKKTDTLKHLMPEIEGCCLTAIQTNAGGDVAMAQQIKWFISNGYFLKLKTVEEISEHGQQFGTHKLIPFKTRIQGEEASGFSNLVPIIDSSGETQLVEDYLCYSFKNFNITEAGSLKEIAGHHTGTLTPSGKSSKKKKQDNDDDDLL